MARRRVFSRRWYASLRWCRRCAIGHARESGSAPCRPRRRVRVPGQGRGAISVEGHHNHALPRSVSPARCRCRWRRRRARVRPVGRARLAAHPGTDRSEAVRPCSVGDVPRVGRGLTRCSARPRRSPCGLPVAAAAERLYRSPDWLMVTLGTLTPFWITFPKNPAPPLFPSRPEPRSSGSRMRAAAPIARSAPGTPAASCTGSRSGPVGS